jgi:hypothetical protein
VKGLALAQLTYNIHLLSFLESNPHSSTISKYQLSAKKSAANYSNVFQGLRIYLQASIELKNWVLLPNTKRLSLFIQLLWFSNNSNDFEPPSNQRRSIK